MKKYRIGVAILAGILLIGLVLWLIGATTEFTFQFKHFVVYTFAAEAIALLVMNLLAKNMHGLALISVVFGAISIFTSISLGLKFLPALIIFVGYCVLVGIIMFLGSRGWDAGDNNDPNYKKYERKDGR